MSPKKSIPIGPILIGGAKIAFVAVLETLISARIADNKTDTRFDPSKETFGMAISNCVTGLVGGTPCTGVLIRTNINVQTGATHKTSQFLNAMTVLIIVALLAPQFTYIPMATIASILVTSSCRLVPKIIMSRLWQCDRFEFWFLLLVWAICIFQDGVVGLLAGAIFQFLRYKVEGYFTKKLDVSDLQMSFENNVLRVTDIVNLNYINVIDFEVRVLDMIKEKNPETLILNLSKMNYIDVDGIAGLEKVFGKAKKAVVVMENKDDESVLCKSWWFQKVLATEGSFFESERGIWYLNGEEVVADA